MARRPAARPRWAYDGTPGRLVEPPEGKRALGFANGEQPPAPWINYIFHWTGATLDWLSGPDLSQWDRHAQSAVTFLSITGMDRDATSDGSGSRFVLAIAGNDSGGPAIAVSKRGGGWSKRDNFSGAPGVLRGIKWLAGKWWCWLDGEGSDVSTLYCTGAAGVSGSAITSNSNPWDLAYTGITHAIFYDLASDAVALDAEKTMVLVSGYQAARSYPVVSVNGGSTWSLNTTTEISYGGAGVGRAVVFDGSH